MNEVFSKKKCIFESYIAWALLEVDAQDSTKAINY